MISIRLGNRKSAAITVTGLRNAVEKFPLELVRDAEMIVKHRLWESMKEVFEAPTGKLFRDFEFRVSKTATGARLDVDVDSVYAEIHERGGIIRPKLGKDGLLIWKNRDGQWFSKKRVRIRAKRYFRTTITRSHREIRSRSRVMIERLRRRVAR